MSSQSSGAFVFYSYSRKDKKFLQELVKHFFVLERRGLIQGWYDTKHIKPGEDFAKAIDHNLDAADIILLLISPNFICSRYCYEIEMRRAIKRYEDENTCVIPVLVTPVVDWSSEPFGILDALPKGGKFIADWRPQRRGFEDVADGLRAVVKELLAKKNGNQTPLNVEANLSPSLYVPRPPVIDFVPRQDKKGRDIVERLKKELVPGKNQMVALYGPYGVGKTALAAEAARVLQDQFAQRILWISVGSLTSLDFSTLLDEIATQLGHAVGRALKPTQKEVQVSKLIAAAPLLIVVDDFQLIAPDEQKRCADFLSKRAQCSVLVTAREKINSKTVLNIPVAAMAPLLTNVYLDRLVAKAKKPHVFATLDPKLILQASESNPLLLQWVVNLIDQDTEPRAMLDRLAHGQGPAAQRIFDYVFNLPQLGDDGRAALLALSMFVPSASREALMEVAEIPDDEERVAELIAYLADLWQVRLLEGGYRLSIENLFRELLRKRLSEDHRAVEFRRRFISHFLDYAELRAQPTADHLDELEIERDNLLTAIDVASEIKDWESMMQLCDSLENLLYLRGYWNEAIQRSEQAIAAAMETKNALAVARFRAVIARIHISRGEYDVAHKMCQQLLADFITLGSKIDIAETLNKLGMISRGQGGFDEARRLYEQSLAIEREVKNRPGIATTLHLLGLVAQEQSDFKEARRLYEQSLAIKRELEDQPGIASSLHNLAAIAQIQGEQAEAQRLYQQSLEIEEKLCNKRGIAVTLNNIATILQSQGDLAEAQRLFNESLKTRREMGDQRGIAIVLHNLGEIAQERGQLDEAQQLYNESLEIKKRLGDPKGMATTLYKMGTLVQSRGDVKEGRRIYEESLKIRQKLGDKSGVAEVIYGFASAAQAQGDLTEAQRLYSESLEIRRGLGERSGIASALHNLAGIAQAQGDLTEAQRLYSESLEIRKSLNEQSGIANSLSQLGTIAHAQRRLKESRQFYSESLEIKKKLGDERGSAGIMYSMSAVEQALGNMAEARRLCEESLKIREKIGDKSGIAMNLYRLGFMAQAEGDLPEARRLYSESLEIRKSLNEQSCIALTLQSLGMLAEIEGDKTEAAGLLREALSIFEKLKLPGAEIARQNLERLEGETS